MAAYFDDMAKLKKLGRRPLKKNPTPLLRELKHKAASFIRQEGRATAYKDARRQAAEYQAMKLPNLARKYRLLARIIKKSPGRKKVTRKNYLEQLIAEYGTTSPMSARGFILEDGECLNLGQYDDHRIINSVYRDSTKAEKRYGSRYGAFRALCERFNMIRWIPESKMAEVFVEPSRQQLAALRELAENGMLREVEVHRRGKSAVLEAHDPDTLIAGVEAVYGS